MKRGKALKLGVVSLLVCLFFVTACSKNKTTTTKNNTTITKNNTTKITTKIKTEEKTTSKTTLEQIKPLKKINVYYNGNLLTNENNTIEFDYGDEFDLSKLLVVKGIRENSSEEELISDYIIDTNLKTDSNAGNYEATIKVGSLTSTINIVLNKIKIDASLLEWDYTEAFTYDSLEHSVSLKDIPDGLNVSYKTNEEDGNSKINAGSYETIALLSVVNDNYEIINNSNSLSLDWSINKAIYDLSNVNWTSTTEFTYDGSSKKVELNNVPKGLKVTYTDNEKVNAGSYKAKINIEKDDTNYEIINNSISEAIDWVIKKKELDLSNVCWNYDSNKPFVYDGKEHTVELINLPDEITPSYSGECSATDSGGYGAKVELSYDEDNYKLINDEDFDDELFWDIVKAKIDMANVCWDYDSNKPFVYDGKEHTVLLLNIPEEISQVDYLEESIEVDAGIYNVYPNFMYDEDNYELVNYSDIVGHFQWEIKKAKIDMFDVYWNYDSNDPFVYDDKEYIVELINVPDEVEANYTDEYYATYVGEYSTEVYFSYSNNYELTNVNFSYTLDWKIVKAKIDMSDVCWNYDSNDPFVYNGSNIFVELIDVPGIIDDVYYSSDYYATDAGCYTAYVDFSYDDTKYELVNVNFSYTLDWEIVRAQIDMANVCWNYDSDNPFVYDGEEHTVELINIPDDIYDVYYYRNYSETDSGEYEAEVELYYDDSNYELVNVCFGNILSWEIEKAQIDMSDVCWNYDSDNPFVYTGEYYTVELINVPSLIEVSYIGEDSETDAGEYYVEVELDYDDFNYELINDSFCYPGFYWEIEKGKIDMSNVRWDYDSDNPFVYDGFNFEVQLINVPDEIYYVSYEDNCFTEAGSYYASAYFDYDEDNYELINLDYLEDSFYWEIKKAEIDMSEVYWNYDGSFIYDGEEHIVELINLPDEINYVNYYDYYSETSAGEYEAEVELYYDEFNYELVNVDFDYTLSWEIKKAEIDMSDVCWNYDGSFIYDGEEHTVELVNVPDEINYVTYEDNCFTEVGFYVATATFSYDDDNYELVGLPSDSLTLDWFILESSAD